MKTALFLPSALLFALCTCTPPSKPGLEVGTLACLDPASPSSPAADNTPEICPLLVVGSGPGDTVRVLGPADRDFLLPSTALRPLGRPPGGIVGATESVVDRMATSANAGVLAPVSDFGLLIGNSDGGTDTLFLESWPALLGEAPACTGWQPCLDSLEASPFHGLLQGPFIPSWRRIQIEEDTFSIGTVAKPKPQAGAGSPWLFIHASNAQGASAWIYRSERGAPAIMETPFMEHTGIISVEAVDWRPEGFRVLLVRTVTYYGDGSYKSLHWVPLSADATKPWVATIGVSGSSGEPGGSDVEAEYWLVPPYIFIATAQQANDEESGESHDLQAESILLSKDGSLAKERLPAARIALLAAPTGRSKSEAWIDSLAAAQPESKRANLRPLPRLTKEGILWQPGAVAPDSATAAAWSARNFAGKVEL